MLSDKSGTSSGNDAQSLTVQPAAPPAETPQPAAVAPLTTRADVSMPRRIRDTAHLKYIASLPCLVCGRTPSHAHHLRFAQLRSLGSKVSDEWTVPVCPIHHRSLHDVGCEEEWWQAKGIDAKSEAERQWRKTHPPSTAVAAALNETNALKPPPADEQGQPLLINLRAGAPRLGDA